MLIGTNRMRRRIENHDKNLEAEGVKMDVESFVEIVKGYVKDGGGYNAVCVLQGGFPVFVMFRGKDDMLLFLQDLKRGGRVVEYGTVFGFEMFDEPEMARRFKGIVRGMEGGVSKDEFLYRLGRVASLFVRSDQSAVDDVLYVAWHSKKDGSDIVLLPFERSVSGKFHWLKRRHPPRRTDSLIVRCPFNVWNEFHVVLK